MMTQLRFDDRVAVVTGRRGLGAPMRCCSLPGAKVVVNDIAPA
ncbi:hypothetical protein BZL30_9492 [Mycobacterium kansasii]|uniref:Uncharacterized protein n=1 Tax=Mycobacterium kansasii TaxID=1768 RepID=A0A1V3W953_MYCKA|nr:hypothetical protein BZL30_9492 [Mycobacterium kansasii]